MSPTYLCYKLSQDLGAWLDLQMLRDKEKKKNKSQK